MARKKKFDWDKPFMLVMAIVILFLLFGGACIETPITPDNETENPTPIPDEGADPGIEDLSSYDCAWVDHIAYADCEGTCPDSYTCVERVLGGTFLEGCGDSTCGCRSGDV